MEQERVNTMDKEEAKRILEKDAIRARGTNVPSIGNLLTLKQLRKMDGKPVYFERGKSWGIVSVDSNGRWEGVPFFVTCKDGVNFIHNIKLRKMKVYEYPPARIDRERWEPCEWCGSIGKKPGNWVCTLENDNGHTVTNNHMVVCAPVNYCPVCGRPLTPEAWEELERRING